MTGYLLLLVLCVAFVWLLLPERPGPGAGLPHRLPKEGECAPPSPGETAAVEFLRREGFDGPLRFLLDEDPREAVHLVNRNLSIHYVRHVAPGEERFLTFFADGSVLVTGTAPLALKSLDGAGLVFGSSHDAPTAELLARHAATLREAVALGRMPRHATPEGFFIDLADCADLADAERIRALHEQQDAGRFVREAPDAAAVAEIVLKRGRDGLSLLASAAEVSVDRSDPLPAELLAQAQGGDEFPLKAYRNASPATAIPLERISAVVIDRYGAGEAAWAFAVFSDDGRMIFLDAPEVAPATGVRGEPAEAHLLHLGWFVRERFPLAQILRFRRADGRPAEVRDDGGL